MFNIHLPPGWSTVDNLRQQEKSRPTLCEPSEVMGQRLDFEVYAVSLFYLVAYVQAHFTNRSQATSHPFCSPQRYL